MLFEAWYENEGVRCDCESCCEMTPLLAFSDFCGVGGLAAGCWTRLLVAESTVNWSTRSPAAEAY